MDRLIDKDAAVKALGDTHFENWGNAAVVISDMPEVPAIPVEWIELHISALEFIGKKESVRRAEAIRNMLGIWRYENERVQV